MARKPRHSSVAMARRHRHQVDKERRQHLRDRIANCEAMRRQCRRQLEEGRGRESYLQEWIHHHTRNLEKLRAELAAFH